MNEQDSHIPVPDRPRLNVDACASCLIGILVVFLDVCAIPIFWTYSSISTNRGVYPIAAFLIALSLLPTVLGARALLQIPRGEAARGVWLARCGLLLGILGIIAPVWELGGHEAMARDADLRRECMSNISMLAKSMECYCEEWGGYFPPPERWNDALRPYTQGAVRSDGRKLNLWVCPASRDNSRPSYAMNAGLKGLRLSDVASRGKTVMLFESVPGRNLAGGRELLPSPSRHGWHGSAIVAVSGRPLYSDGAGEYAPQWTVSRCPPSR